MFFVEHEICWPELQERVREVTLLESCNDKTVQPYKDAVITLKELEFTTVRPTSLYVITKNLQIQEKLSEHLGNEGYDPLALKGGLQVSDGKSSIGLIPPIVEKTAEQGLYILDGAHRTYRGWRAGRATFWALHLENIRDDCPSYALPNEWSQIIEYEEVPTDPLKKKVYRANYRSLYRDFSTLNGSKLRESN